jgi:hypothetical protein
MRDFVSQEFPVTFGESVFLCRIVPFKHGGQAVIPASTVFCNAFLNIIINVA